MRRPGDSPETTPAYVLLFTTLGAPERRRLLSRKQQSAAPEPDPAPVTTGRGTVIEATEPFEDPAAAAAWLKGAGEPRADDDLAVLNRALHAFRLVTANAYIQPVHRGQLIAARIGYGTGDEVAEGRWTAATELLGGSTRERRAKVLQPQARLAAMLGEREQALVCEELALRAHLDIEHGRPREAALQVLVALDAAIAELSVDPTAGKLGDRIDELRAQRDGITAAAQAALAGPLTAEQREAVEFTLGRIEAALRARAVANA